MRVEDALYLLYILTQLVVRFHNYLLSLISSGWKIGQHVLSKCKCRPNSDATNCFRKWFYRYFNLYYLFMILFQDLNASLQLEEAFSQVEMEDTAMPNEDLMCEQVKILLASWS